MTQKAPWRRYVTEEKRLRGLPRGLVEWLDAGGVIQLVVRYSTPAGKKAIAALLQNRRETFDTLLEMTGLRIHEIGPSDGEVVEAFRKATPRKSVQRDSTTFNNTFVTYDYSREAQVVILLSIGSGSKIDSEMRQPFVEEATRVYLAHDTCLLFAKRDDRAGRANWALGHLMTAIQETNGYLGDQDGIVQLSDAEDITRFLKGTQSRGKAKKLPGQSRKGQFYKSSTEMVDGQAAYHGGTPPPPGFGRATLRTGTRADTKLIYLDTAGCRPPALQVAFGLSEVTDAHGELADQVDNVRWLLAHYGKPAWTRRSLGDELVARRFSSVGLREKADDPTRSATFENVSHLIDTVLGNLSVYETGVFERQLGSGVDPIRIENCFPPQGAWAAPEDFARIRTTLRDSEKQYRGKRKLTFASLEGTYDGTPVRLCTDHERDGRPKRGLRYRYRYPEGPTSSRAIVIPATTFHNSLIDAIRKAGDHALPLVTDAPDPKARRLEAEAINLTSQLDAARSRQQAILDNLTRPEATSSALFTALQHEYDTLESDRIPNLEDRIRDTRIAIDEHTRNMATAHHSQLLRLVASLSDPTDQTHNRLWIKTIKNLTFTTQRDEAGRRYLQWTGQLLIGDDDSAYAITFHGTHQPSRIQTHKPRPAAVTTDDLIDQHVQALRTGTPYATNTVRLRRRLRPNVAKRLGIPTDHPLFTLIDPRIIRILTFCLEHPDTPDTECATQLGEDPRLVTRVRTIHPPEAHHPRTSRRHHRATVALHALAAAQDGHVTADQAAKLIGTTHNVIWTVVHQLRNEGWPWQTLRKRGYQLAPCSCGSYARAPLTIPEPNGPVCLNCRRDLSGILWPADPYDRYIAHPELWHTRSPVGPPPLHVAL